MSTMRKRLDELEERRAFREFMHAKRQFEGRSRDELRFFTKCAL
jgi:hypothetical protein